MGLVLGVDRDRLDGDPVDARRMAMPVAAVTRQRRQGRGEGEERPGDPDQPAEEETRIHSRKVYPTRRRGDPATAGP